MSQNGWTTVPERGSTWVMWFGMTLLRMLGYPVGLVLVLASSLYFFLTGRSSRCASRDFLTHLNTFAPHVLGPASVLKTLRHHINFGINVLDRIWFWQGNLKRFQFIRNGRQHIQERKGGILLMGSHLGSFDALRAYSLDKQVKLNVVMYRAHAVKFNQLIKALNPEANLQVVDLDEGNIEQVFVLKERLEAGEIVAILGDRPAPFGRKRLVHLPFLGEDAPFPQNPWILASLLECPVFFTAGVRVGLRKYHLMVEPMADRIILPRKTRVESLHVYMEQYVRRLEALCLDHPYQWFNFYDFWKTPEDPGPGGVS